jgi:hypothetical protein
LQGWGAQWSGSILSCCFEAAVVVHRQAPKPRPVVWLFVHRIKSRPWVMVNEMRLAIYSEQPAPPTSGITPATSLIARR